VLYTLRISSFSLLSLSLAHTQYSSTHSSTRTLTHIRKHLHFLTLTLDLFHPCRTSPHPHSSHSHIDRKDHSEYRQSGRCTPFLCAVTLLVLPLFCLFSRPLGRNLACVWSSVSRLCLYFFLLSFVSRVSFVSLVWCLSFWFILGTVRPQGTISHSDERCDR
jgi:hypothetical protein